MKFGVLHIMGRPCPYWLIATLDFMFALGTRFDNLDVARTNGKINGLIITTFKCKNLKRIASPISPIEMGIIKEI